MSEIHMLQLELDPGALIALGKRRALPVRDLDLGYVVHCHLGELFGDDAPSPFSISTTPKGQVRVLGYADRPAEALKVHADTFADPALHASCSWDRFSAKRLPSNWETGQRLGFEVRVCPVVRMNQGTDRHRKGAEVDAFLAKCWTVGPEVQVDREAIYIEWFERQLVQHGGARALRVGLAAFKRERVVRRTQGEQRKAAISERPDAVLRGELEVTDGAAFNLLLRRGIGRHRAFGFGMLLLRRPERAC